MNQLFQQIVAWYGGGGRRLPQRKSRWNLILIPLWLVFWLGIWYGLFRLVWAFHIMLYPEHALQDFWRDGAGLPSFLSSFLMVFALMPGAICLGLALANCAAWLIAPARRALEVEATGYPGAGFREATRALFILSAWAVPLSLIIALIAAWNLISLK